MARPKSDGNGLNEIVSKSLKGDFDLDKFKKSKFLNKNIGFKNLEYIPVHSCLPLS